jgi:ribosome-binding protein aMBF1 (putative translation factor)
MALPPKWIFNIWLFCNLPVTIDFLNTNKSFITLLGNNELNENEIKQFNTDVMLKIKDTRKEKGVSQLELAYFIGHKSVSAIGKIKSNLENKHYNLEHLHKIAKVLDIDIKVFLKTIKRSTLIPLL